MFWIRRLNIFKMLIFRKLIYKFHTVPTQIPESFIEKKHNKLDELILKYL